MLKLLKDNMKPISNIFVTTNPELGWDCRNVWACL